MLTRSRALGLAELYLIAMRDDNCIAYVPNGYLCTKRPIYGMPSVVVPVRAPFKLATMFKYESGEPISESDRRDERFDCEPYKTPTAMEFAYVA